MYGTCFQPACGMDGTAPWLFHRGGVAKAQSAAQPPAAALSDSSRICALSMDTGSREFTLRLEFKRPAGTRARAASRGRSRAIPSRIRHVLGAVSPAGFLRSVARINRYPLANVSLGGATLPRPCPKWPGRQARDSL